MWGRRTADRTWAPQMLLVLDGDVRLYEPASSAPITILNFREFTWLAIVIAPFNIPNSTLYQRFRSQLRDSPREELEEEAEEDGA